MKPRNPILVLVWSFGLFILIQVQQFAGIFVASLVSGADFNLIMSGEFKNHLTKLCIGLTSAIIGIPFILLIVKYLWKRTWDWMCLHFNIGLLIKGFIFGFIFPFAVLFILKFSVSLKIVAYPDRFTLSELISYLIGGVGWMLFIATSEEIIFRGMVVREWALKWGWVIATILGGAYFGACHLIGLFKNITLLNSAWIIIAAIIFNSLVVALYIKSKSLWLPIGFHAGWNYCLESFLGITISGNEPKTGFYLIDISGSEILTGGLFGIEASIVTMILTIIAVIVILFCSKTENPVLLSSKIDNSP